MIAPREKVEANESQGDTQRPGASLVTYDLGLELRRHSLVVQSSSDITLAASAAVEVVAQGPVLRLEAQKDRLRAE